MHRHPPWATQSSHQARVIAIVLGNSNVLHVEPPDIEGDPAPLEFSNVASPLDDNNGGVTHHTFNDEIAHNVNIWFAFGNNTGGHAANNIDIAYHHAPDTPSEEIGGNFGAQVAFGSDWLNGKVGGALRVMDHSASRTATPKAMAHVSARTNEHQVAA